MGPYYDIAALSHWSDPRSHRPELPESEHMTARQAARRPAPIRGSAAGLWAIALLATGVLLR